jgi:hypothetical protein
MQAEHDQRKAAQGKAHQQDFAGADMIGKITHRRLGQAGYDGKDGKGKAKLDVADAELILQKGEQHRQHEHMEMTDPMGGRNRRKGAVRAVGFRLSFCLGFRLLRCSQNVDHFRFRPVWYLTARQGLMAEIIGQAGYLSMNTAAWQPSRMAAERR